MIITVTLNPAIDKTVDVDNLMVGELNRIKNVTIDAGGKGINVSKTIKALDGQSVALGFLGGNSGKIIVNELDKLQISHDFVYVDGETRTNTKVISSDGTLTELNEQGFVASSQNIDDLMDKIEKYADEQSIFVLAGSIPKGVSTDIYANITQLVHNKGGKVLLDADGELFTQSVIAKPDILKPNTYEITKFIGKTQATEQEILQTASNFVKNGTKIVAISQGKDGAIFVIGDKQYKVQGLKVDAHSTVGAGDAMVSGLAYALDNGLDDRSMIKLCMAVSAGAVTTIGTKPPSKKLVLQLEKQVILP